MEEKRIWLRKGEYRAKWHRCAGCGLYFINRSLALEAILQGCPGCIRQNRVGSSTGMMKQPNVRYQADRPHAW